MSVQFECPSCGNPIEIDDEWASQSVSCPFCKSTVRAPESSTYEPPPMTPSARPVGSMTTGVEVGGIPVQTGSNAAALWALGLSILWVIGFMGANFIMGAPIVEAVGEDASPYDAQRYVQEQISQGQMPPWFVKGLLVMLFSGLLWIGGLICAIFGLRIRRRRSMAIVALCLLSLGPLILIFGFLSA